MNSSRPILCLMGPTATGKTDLAIALTQHYPFEIISVDSAMVYRGMDIGTAKPTPEEQALAPHRLIDICDPEEPYSAGQFLKEALEAIKDIQQRGKIPLLVGGTMLYFHALQNGVASLPTADEAVRLRLSNEANAVGWQEMHKKLQSIDPEMADQLHPNDSQRIQRALEVYEITGQTMTKLQSLQSHNVLSSINIVLEPENRQTLRDRIAERFNLMLKKGFIDEVADLKKRPKIHKQLPAIRTVGYRQVWSYLENEYDKKTMEEKAIVATRQLAKRQLTWLRRWPNVHRYFFETAHLKDQVCQRLEKEGLFEHYH